MPELNDLSDWLDEQTETDIVWFLKRLAANDTLATKAHQAGPYIPKEFMFDMFPSLKRPQVKNPEKHFQICIDSHGDARTVRAVWYNNKFRGGTRNEARITNLGGTTSALLDPDATGALAVFAFHRPPGTEPDICHVWVCDHEVEEDLIEDRIGPIEPGRWTAWSLDERETNLFWSPRSTKKNCQLSKEAIPLEWREKFPSGLDIIQKTVEFRPGHGIPVDLRLIKRRDCEYQIFRSVEECVELPIIQQGFNNIEEFVSRAQTILQRRKSRSGRSLELHTREIFIEENLSEGKDFEYQPESEGGKNPDFLFPSGNAYRDPAFPRKKLRMLGVKTTCKDRWRQIINEADRVQQKHLLTLQEGVSEGQFREMLNAKIQLVVPAPLMEKYPKAVRPHLQSLESFIADVRLLTVS